MAFQDNYWIALKKHDLLSDRIYTVYPWYIPGIYQVYTASRNIHGISMYIPTIYLVGVPEGSMISRTYDIIDL